MLSRIIQLSLPTKTLFLILAPRPLSTRLGAFFYPETFSCKFFPKFFPPKGRRTFFYFYGAKNYGGKGLFSPQNRGGCPSFMPFLHIAKGLPSCRPSSSLVVNFQPIGANFRQKGSKVNEFLGVLGVFSGFSETKNGKSEIYFGFGAFVVLLSSSFVVAVVESTECRWCAPAPSLWVCSVPLPFLCPFTALLVVYCI